MLETLDHTIRIGSTPTFYISICISTLPTQHTTFKYGIRHRIRGPWTVRRIYVLTKEGYFHVLVFYALFCKRNRKQFSLCFPYVVETRVKLIETFEIAWKHFALWARVPITSISRSPKLPLAYFYLTIIVTEVEMISLNIYRATKRRM